MSEEISIIDTEKEISLETNKEDLMALFLKSIFGVVPFGSPIGESISAIIPHQKLDRLIDFVKILNYKLKNAERKIEEHELKTAEFTDLLEDAYLQASRALSKERIEYIASLLKNSLTDEEIEHLGKKKLVSLLAELNDSEIIWLKNFSFYTRNVGVPEYKEFYDKHEKVLKPIPVYLGSDDNQVEKNALQKSYKDNLLQLGLLKEKFSLKRGGIPEFDENTGKIKVSRMDCTRLGRLLLRYLDLTEKQED